MKIVKALVCALVCLLVACSAQQTAPVIPAKQQVSKMEPVYPAPKKQAPKVSTKRSVLLPSARELISESKSAMSAGDYKLASAKAERAIRISPRAPEVYLALSEVRLRQKRYSQAEQMLMKAISVSANSKRSVSNLWLKVARVREIAGDSDGAEAARVKARR